MLARADASAHAEVLRCESQLRGLNALEELPSVDGGKPKIRLLAPEGDTSDPLSTAARILELIKQHTIASNVIKIAKWFKGRMDLFVVAGWNITIIWQKDQGRKFLGRSS